MKYKILKKAIRINNYNTERNIFSINLSLMNNKIEILNYNSIVNPAFTNLYSNIKDSIIQFKNSQAYIDAIKKIDIENTVEATNNLSKEYNIINDVSDLTYFDVHYPDVSDEDYSGGSIIRYIAKFLNHNNLIEVSLSDYNDINNKNANTHFETYDVITISWKLNGIREEVFEANTKELNRLKTIFGDFNTFYALNEFDSGPFYLTIYDEIPNLYTIGGELIYEDILTNYSGYYHYFKGRLWSGVSDALGPNKYLIEEVVEDFGDDTSGDDILSDVDNLLSVINNELNKFQTSPNVLDNLEKEINGLFNEFSDDLQNSFNEFLDGSDLKDVFNESMKDAEELQATSDDGTLTYPDKQNEIEEKYNDKAESALSGAESGMTAKEKQDFKKVKKKSPKIPKIKIPNVHVAGKKHEEGTDHNYELGF